MTIRNHGKGSDIVRNALKSAQVKTSLADDYITLPCCQLGGSGPRSQFPGVRLLSESKSTPNMVGLPFRLWLGAMKGYLYLAIFNHLAKDHAGQHFRGISPE